MTVELIRSVLMWSTVINVGLLLFATLCLITCSDFVYRIHGRIFPMSKETFNVVVYSWLGLYKILIIVFNVVPWIAICLSQQQ